MNNTESEFLSVFQKYFQSYCRYCCVCLRMEDNHYLFKPKAFREYLDRVSGVKLILNDNSWICLVCESKAKVALDFLKATRLAASIQNVFGNMMESRSCREAIDQHLKNITVKDHLLSLNSIEKELKTWRSQTELIFTEVLTIDSTKEEKNIQKHGPLALASYMEKENEIKVNEIAKKIIVDLTKKSKSPKDLINDVIVLDDEEPSESNIKIRKSRKSRKNIQPHTDLYENRDNKKLTNINIQTNTKNPILLQLLDNKKDVSGLTLPKFNINIIPSLYIQQHACDNSITMTVPDISTQNGGKLTPIEPQPLMIIPNNLVQNVWPVKITTEAILNSNEPITMVEMVEIDHNGTNVVENERQGVKRTIGEIETGRFLMVEKGQVKGVSDELVKEPVLKSVKIDWEDKIPMDLISFAEPTNNISTTSVGVITDVRSINKMFEEPTTVIDLCNLD